MTLSSTLALPVANRSMGGMLVSGAGGGITGLEALGTIGGILGAVATMAGVWIALRAQNRSIYVQRQQELRAEYDRGHQIASADLAREIDRLRDDVNEARSERDYWRSRAE